MSFTRKSLADHIDGYDEQITELQDSKREMFLEYRAQLEGLGYSRDSIKCEIEAIKAAIKRRRAVNKDADAVEEKDALIDEVFIEITSSRVPRATRVENIEESTPDPSPSTVADGQPQPSSSPGSAKSDGPQSIVGQGRESGVNHTGNEEEQAVTSFEPPAFIRKAPTLRPDCLNPDSCSGYGSHQCHACTKAAQGVAA